MTKEDVMYFEWLCKKAKENKDLNLDQWLSFIREHAEHLKRLHQVRKDAA